MWWPRICLILAFLQNLGFSSSLTSPEDINWTGALSLKYEDSSLPGILSAVGGVKELKAELFFIMTEASSLRGGISTSKFVSLDVGRYAILAKICFEDGICWATKMYENRPGFYNRGIDHGILAMELVQKYCPDIPISTPRGCGMHKLRYCFTDWIEGENLYDRYFVKEESAEVQIIRIPEKVVTSLAEFIYNLTTCSIPERESNNSSFIY
jgi:hypothetical protein